MAEKKRKRLQRRRSPVEEQELILQPRGSETAETVPAPEPVGSWEPHSAPEFSYGGAAVDLKFDTGSLPAVRLSFGDLFALERKRPIREGWGYAAELPAVLDLLERIEEGQVTAASARSVLLKAADALYDTFRCWEAEDSEELRDVCRRAGGCVVCEERHSWFDALLDGADDRWRRLEQPEVFPFAAGRQGLHAASCSVVRRETPAHYSRPTGIAYTQALNAFSHTVDPYSSREDFEGSGTYPRFEAMTAQEARKWIAARSGPKGGRHYKRCQRCAPAI